MKRNEFKVEENKGKEWWKMQGERVKEWICLKLEKGNVSILNQSVAGG